MASFNTVTLLGNCTRTPEVRYTTSGTAVAETGIAVNSKFKDREEVSFFDVTFWGKTAEIAAEYLEKGKQFLVSGRLKQDTWETDGQKRSKVVVVCETMQLLGSPSAKQEESEEKSSTKPAKAKAAKKEEKVPDDESIPF